MYEYIDYMIGFGIAIVTGGFIFLGIGYIIKTNRTNKNEN